MAATIVYYIMGVSGCGKSTVGTLLAERLKIPFYDGDDYHPEPNIEKMSSGTPLNDEDRLPWLLRINEVAIQSLENNGCVFACSALKEDYRDILSSTIADQCQFVFLQGSFDLILQRMQDRNHFMPPDLLQSQFDTLEEPSDALTIDIQVSPDKIIEAILQIK